MTAEEAPSPPPAFPTEDDIDAVIYEFHGDMREAIRALLSDLAVLAEDANARVSYGFVRGKLIMLRRPGDAPQG